MSGARWDAEIARALFSPVRLSILLELAIGERTLTQLAETLKLAPSTVHYHIRKLMELGLVEVSRVEQRGNLTIKYYRLAEEEHSLRRLSRKDVPPQAVISCMTAFLARALEKSFKTGRPGMISISILNVDEEELGEAYGRLMRAIEEVKGLEDRAERRDTTLLLTVIATAYPAAGR